MKEKYKEFASKIADCEFTYNDFKISGRILGSKVFASLYELKISYKDHFIFVRNELGQSNMGKIVAVLKHANFPDFEITTRNHFTKLFSGDKSTFRIKCDNDSLANYIRQRIGMCNLEQIAKDNLFEPKIYTSLHENKTEIITDYHLEFEDKTGALTALVSFYKSLVDYSVRRYVVF